MSETQVCDLTQKNCKPCEGGVKPLDSTEIDNLMPQIPEWEFIADKQEIQRTFKFKNYYQTMAFVNAVAWMAHQQDHHPDLEVSYNRCLVRYSTHAIGGLSDNDFICAAKVDALLQA
ncbi:MAG: 4a-hydroxytetrahydrobiopterin dehydratase [Gammaproteobacteria bacterium]|nr:4a-hydroxytetrahydrobiopterin dehydratase [Gammaproteobacteria bacterium]MDH5800159.1 4a-hydroxytetrahydrobiopterin dehydratase [Gammaproteobacteria bacterium]